MKHHGPGYAGWICNTDDLLSLQQLLLIPFNTLWDDIHACASLSAEEKRAFDWELEAFRAWVRAPLPLCDADAEIRTGNDFMAKLARWRGRLAEVGCTPSAQALPELDPSDPRSAQYEGLLKRLAEGKIESPLDKVNSILKTTAIVGGIGLALYGLYLAAPLVRSAASKAAYKT
jgi:hypothetical protein